MLVAGKPSPSLSNAVLSASNEGQSYCSLRACAHGRVMGFLAYPLRLESQPVRTRMCVMDFLGCFRRTERYLSLRRLSLISG